jgi:hypothetical protein
MHDPANQIGSTFRIRGDLEVWVRDPAGNPLRRFAIRNTIVYGGLNSALFLWAQDGITPTDYQISVLAAGSGVVPPTKGDIALNAPLPGGPTGGVITLDASNRTVSPSTGELIFNAQLDTTRANGYTLGEAGLFLGNTQLFARQVHPLIPKTSAITVSYTWRIAVTS